MFFVSTYNYLGYPAVMEIKPLLKKIGKINNLILEMPQQSSTLKESQIKKWRTKDLGIPNIHLDLASHLISLLIYFFNSVPTKVNSFEIKNSKKSYIDNAFTWLRFKKFIGHLWFSKNATGKRNELSIQIFGNKGSLQWTHNNPEEVHFFDNSGNISIINRLSKKTKYLSNKKDTSTEIINMGIIIEENISDLQIDKLIKDANKISLESKFISMSRSESNTTINLDIRPTTFEELTKLTGIIKKEYKKSKVILSNNSDLSL